MKKIIAMLMALLLAAMAISCGSNTNTSTTESKETVKPEESTTTTEATSSETEETTSETEETTSESEEDTSDAEPADEAMTYDEFMAAAVDDEVTVDCYVMAHQSWWEDKISVYATDEQGAYFLYNMACSEEDAEKLTEGTKIRVKGYKAEWSGEIEIADATFEFLEEDTLKVYPEDLTDVFGTEDLITRMNQKFLVSGVKIAASKDADGNDVPFLYNYDGSGQQGDDLYFNVDINGEIYNFTVESYLCGKDTDVYKAVEAFEIGQVVEMEGFLYWYNGPNPHITGVFEPEADEGQMTYLQYKYDAQVDDEVTMKLYVQDTQSWWEDKISVYAATRNGGVFVYNMACSEEDAKKLVPGTQIIVKGYKGEWSGEKEIVDATFEFGNEATYIAEPKDLTYEFGMNPDMTEEFQNFLFTVKDAEITASKDADGNDVPYLYSWDGSGQQGDDLYFNVTIGGTHEYTFTVESYLRGKDTDVYKAVEGLSIGDKVDLTGFLYWYNGANPHITECVKAE